MIVAQPKESGHPAPEDIRAYFRANSPAQGVVSNECRQRYVGCDHPKPESSLGGFFDHAVLVLRCLKCRVVTLCMWSGGVLAPLPPSSKAEIVPAAGDKRWYEIPL